MNRTTYLALAFVVLVSGYVMFSGDDESVTLESAVLSKTPVVDNPKSNELPRPVNTKKEDPVVLPKEGEADEIDRAYQYQMAVAEFETLAPDEQLQQRKASLGKLITGKKMSVNDEVALQQDWERAGRAEPGYQHKKESHMTVDVNGVAIETGRPGMVVEDSVMVYIPVSKSSFSSELNSISGIDNIEQVFKTIATPQNSGIRDPAGWHRIELSAPASRIQSIVRALKSFNDVTEAEPVYERKLSITGPLVSDLNDPKMTDQWHLGAAKVNEAWEFMETNSLPAGGDDSIVVAVIDTGVDYDHPDLAANMWINTQEIPGNGIDDDNNGFVDDIHGVTVVGGSVSHSGDPDDDHGHGTHVAGIISSTGANGVGGVGVAFNSKIMAIKAGQYSGVLTTTDIAEGIYYAVDNGADVINMSFGGYGRSQVEQDALAIAYSKAVLIAAAGNDGIPNQPCPIIGAPMYPAAHPWVVGVMARMELPDITGNYLAGFSNRECKPKNGLEYELQAPGVAVWSTLPDGSYSAWSGTSMAAPVASGIAVLARTRYPDKSTYSSRFIMGQLVATDNGVANALASVSTVPEPDLAYEEHWLFDDTTTYSLNDNDGRVDAGETVELAVTIRNRWGRADNVVATLSTPSGASAADPYVTLQTASVNYGAVGSFNKDDNGLVYNDELLVTGVTSPFVFSVAENTPNNHIIPFTLTMTAENGLDPNDSNSYTFTSKFNMVVQRGRELPSFVDGDAAGTDGGDLDTDGVENGIVTLDSSALWIIDKPVLVAVGTTLAVTEGAQIQFWSSSPDATQTQWRPAYLRVEGTLDINGSALNPVEIFTSSLYPRRLINIIKATDAAVLKLNYANVTKIDAMQRGAWDEVNYNYFYQLYPSEYSVGSNITATSPGEMYNYLYNTLYPYPEQQGNGIGNRFYKIAHEAKYYREGDRYYYAQSLSDNYTMSLFDNVNGNFGSNHEDNVFLINNQKWVNAGGDYTTAAATLNGTYSFDSEIFEPFTFNGKTYAIMYNHFRDPWDTDIRHPSILAAQSFAKSLGGSLYTPSSEEELTAVNDWLYDLRIRDEPTSYFQEKYSVCEPMASDDENMPFCAYQIGKGNLENYYQGLYTVGLIRQNDGSYAWDGDDNGYGDTFLESQDYSLETMVVQGLIFNDRANVLNEDGSLSLYILSSLGAYKFNQRHAQRIIVELPGEMSLETLSSVFNEWKANAPGLMSRNAILNNWRDLKASRWMELVAPNGDTQRRWKMTLNLSNNFWGGASSTLIDQAITDFNDNFELADAKYLPIMSVPEETIYPFVVNAEVLDAEGNRPTGDRFGAQESKWRITFNRDMDTTAQPLVTFGPAEPYTDFSVPGDWIDAKTWEGTFTFNSITGDGWQNIRVVGGVAATNPRLVTGDDSQRFQFELVTSGVEALTLQASSAVGSVSLSWTQDDFELLHGYNLYRSLSEDGTYTRINSSTINKSITSFLDTDVTPGVPHYYYFTVVSDGGESDPSNIAMATPVDTIDPVITHKTETVVSLDDSLTLRATVTDNIAVSSVDIVFRNAASSSWQSRAMLLTDSDENRYSVTMDANDIGNQYLEYYIEAKDAVNTVTSGSAESPYKVFVSLPSDTDTDGDGVSNADDAFPYDPTETTDLDGDGVGDNADLDDDGDGYNDDVDAFPRDASEWVDTDGDGIGNNSDNDDDNDGVNDGSDRFPLDARGSRDSDNDGMPDQWETDNGLDPNDASDADSDADFDGFTALQEFEADTSPLVSDQITQIVYHESSPFVAGFANNVRVMYRPSDASSGLNGLGLRVHYNSQYIESLVIDDLLLVDLVAVDAVSMPDSADFDDDPLTDSYMNIAWATTSGGSSWPGGSPVKLFDMKVSFSESVTANTKIHIRFTSSSTHPGYGFSSVPIKTTVNVNSLDIDGNGDPDALSDGLLILRSLFGLTDDALIQNAVATDANFSSSAAIQSRINNLGDFLDIDGNGAVDPLSDGLLILRYLFGIRGATLINGVVAQDATRNTAAEIEEYLAKMVPVL